MTDEHVEYWANDLGLKAWVKIKVSVEEFLELLIQHGLRSTPTASVILVWLHLPESTVFQARCLFFWERSRSHALSPFHAKQ
jgi:hypothetical protein